MIARTSAFLLIGLATLSGCSQLGHDSGTIDEVRKAALGVVAAYNAQDAHAAAAYDAPDYVGIYHGSPNTVGPAADEAAMKSQAAAGHVDWQLGDGKVTVSKAGDLGIYEAPYTFTVTNPDKSVTRETGNWIAIFRRQDDGTLKLWRSIASDTPSPKPSGAA
jgi:ketosteroid isomerase-like protein